MSTTRIQVMVPPAVTTPRGSIWAAEAAARLAHKLGAAVHGLGRLLASADREASPYRRATPMLLEAIGRNAWAMPGAIGRSLWASLESFGQRRAARELHAVADRWQSTDPELSRLLRAAASDDTTTDTAAR